MDEGLESNGFLGPDASIPSGEGRDRAHRRIDQHPAFAIRHQPETAASGAAERHHAFCRRAGPAVQLLVGIKIDVRSVGVSKQQRPTTVADDGEVRR